MNCRKKLSQIVMVIFYRVDPSDVKKLTGNFGEVFKKTCALTSKEDTERWRQALVEVATIAGYPLSNEDNEADTIERIATDVLNELFNSAPSNDFNSYIGMRAHREKIERFLCLASDAVRMIGIWGPSGIGKTTIARFIYNIYSHQFQLCFFIENIKENHPRPYQYSAKMKLQEEFLSGLINQKDIKINHLGVIQERLKHQSVFIVLDDVDHLMQLHALAKETRWFGLGSRIIITTQDKRILEQHKINNIYKVDFPRDDEALQMFCMYAFSQSYPNEGFGNLAWETTQLCGNLPLGLEVIGSHFKEMKEGRWKVELARLRTSLNGDIETILKFSYDALSEEEKRLFRYIACFFNNELIEKVEAHLAENFDCVRHSIRILVEKSLISINWGYIRMHNLLSLLGREIVRKQFLKNSGKCEFLLNAKDACQVLRINDTDVCGSVIGIDSMDEFIICNSVLERIYNLQFLRIHCSYHRSRYFLQNSYPLPPKVKLLHWKYFPMRVLPYSLNPKLLVELELSGSNLVKLWEGIQIIPNLKWINLSNATYLKELPDLSTATKLQNLNLCYCLSLEKLHSSIGNAINLQNLDLSDCWSLMELPSSIGNVINLKKLNLKNC